MLGFVRALPPQMCLKRKVLHTFLLEYSILGIATGFTAAVIGTVTAWSIIKFVMEMEWHFEAWSVLGTIILCLIVTLIAGFAGTWRAMGQKVSPLLRNE